ncbi:MAG: hypothetical protein D4R67_11305 [Bacteroidetes bacterium]|nr:MAG: hypothetical protein D4R67_11305 [Bacteroidota bacterium]
MVGVIVPGFLLVYKVTKNVRRETKDETRNPKPETRHPKPETRNPKPETRNLHHTKFQFGFVCEFVHIPSLLEGQFVCSLFDTFDTPDLIP